MKGGPGEQAFNRALKLLAYRARSAAEVRNRLRQIGFSQSTIDATLKKLIFLSLLDDESFAKSWALTRARERGYGPLRIQRELQAKGIEPSTIVRILREDLSEELVKDRARSLLQKKFGGKDLDDYTILRRAVTFLQRRGYTNSLIREIVGQWKEDDL